MKAALQSDAALLPALADASEHALADGVADRIAARAARSFDVFCTVRVSHTFENLSAHVELDGHIAIAPGDRVLVHGAPINPAYGETHIERRRATVTRATFLGRIWAHIQGQFQCISLLDVSFSDRRTL
jgi:hypothetical protein